MMTNDEGDEYDDHVAIVGNNDNNEELEDIDRL